MKRNIAFAIFFLLILLAIGVIVYPLLSGSSRYGMGEVGYKYECDATVSSGALNLKLSDVDCTQIDSCRVYGTYSVWDFITAPAKNNGVVSLELAGKELDSVEVGVIPYLTKQYITLDSGCIPATYQSFDIIVYGENGVIDDSVKVEL